MIPLRDENPTRVTPVITWMLVIANIVVFVAQLMGSTREHPGLMQFALVPKEITTGTQVGPFPAVEPAWMTMFTSMFMHGGLLHIGSNMLYLVIFGNNIEDRLGHFRFLAFYILAGLAASIAHIISVPGSTVPTVGASGAIAGVLGAYIILFPGARIHSLLILGWMITTAEIPAIIVLGLWILTQFLSAGIGGGMMEGGGIAYWAHIGGFIAGMVLIFVFGGYRRSSSRRYRFR